MGKSINKVMLLGNVGKDPEIRATAGGMMVANFSLATTDRYQDQQGNWQDRAEWHNIKAFKRTAEIVRDYVTKGSKLYIEGKITTNSWDDKETGQKRYRTEIIVNDLVLLGGKGDQDGNSGNGTAARSHTTQTGSAQSSYGGSARNDRQQTATQHGDAWENNTEISDDDIPF